MALGPSINGFLSGCRPVISIDATYLKGKYISVLFVVAAKNSNEQIYPLAFVFADGRLLVHGHGFYQTFTVSLDLPRVDDYFKSP